LLFHPWQFGPGLDPGECQEFAEQKRESEVARADQKNEKMQSRKQQMERKQQKDDGFPDYAENHYASLGV
jgi:hypothetical protein